MTRRARAYDDVEMRPHVGDLPLFSMVRRTDPPTSTLAADAIASNLTALQEAVLTVYRAYGPMTAKQAERLPELANMGFSTARKRVSELAALGKLEATGVVVDRCAEYRVRKEAT